MSKNIKYNSVKTNNPKDEKLVKTKVATLNFTEFIGWSIALLFPFAALGLMEITKMPILSSIIYYSVLGIYLRIKIDGKLPYFKPQLKKVMLETILFILSAILCNYLYLSGGSSLQPITWELIINLFVFALINGTFEHLVWVNIYELAGKRNKYLGVLASTIYVGLIHSIFWLKFLPPTKTSSIVLFVLCQFLIFFIPLRIYEKTKDLTLWSIQHILYNSLAVLFGGFSIMMYMFLK